MLKHKSTYYIVYETRRKFSYGYARGCGIPIYHLRNLLVFGWLGTLPGACKNQIISIILIVMFKKKKYGHKENDTVTYIIQRNYYVLSAVELS